MVFYKSRNGVILLHSWPSSHPRGATHCSNRAIFSSSSATLASRLPVVSTERKFVIFFDLKY